MWHFTRIEKIPFPVHFHLDNPAWMLRLKIIGHRALLCSSRGGFIRCGSCYVTVNQGYF